MQLIQRSSSALFYLKKNVRLPQLISIVEEAYNSSQNLSLNNKATIMMILSQLYLANVINFRVKVSQFSTSFYKQNYKNNRTVIKRKRQRDNFTTTVKRKKQIPKGKQNQGPDLEALLEKELQKNSNTLLQDNNFVGFMSPRRSVKSDEEFLFQPSFKKEDDLQTTMDEYKKIIGSCEVFSKVKRPRDQTKKKKNPLGMEKLKHNFHDNIEIELKNHLEREQELNLTFEKTKTKMKRKQQIFDLQFVNNKIKSLENCKKVSFNREKLKIFDKEHIRAEHPSQYLSSNHYGFSPQFFSQNSDKKYQAMKLSSQIIMNEEFQSKKAIFFDDIVLKRKLGKKEKARIFHFILNDSYKLSQGEPFGPIMIEKN